MSQPYTGRRVLVTGGTGSLGHALVNRMLDGTQDEPESVTVYSRDEWKQWQQAERNKHHPRLKFVIGDVRDRDRLAFALRGTDIVYHAAAMKQIVTCEYAPEEAVKTDVLGAINLVQAIALHRLHVETVIGISTDKACEPVNTYGMCKALQERIFIGANLQCPETRFALVRYGNVLQSRGSVLPLFKVQMREGGPLTVTHPDMTRFLLSLRDAVDTVFAATTSARPGEIYVPSVPSARISDLAAVFAGDKQIEVKVTGIRPGEKLHETLVSSAEARRTSIWARYFVIRPELVELRDDEQPFKPALTGALCSADHVIDRETLRALLKIDEGV